MSNGNMVGFTNDGKVFLVIRTVYEGKDCQTQVLWEPKSARDLAKALTDAAEGAEGKINGRDSTNVN